MLEAPLRLLIAEKELDFCQLVIAPAFLRLQPFLFCALSLEEFGAIVVVLHPTFVIVFILFYCVGTAADTANKGVKGAEVTFDGIKVG